MSGFLVALQDQEEMVVSHLLFADDTVIFCEPNVEQVRNVRADNYHGSNQIRVGNGQGLRILHIGSATLPSSSHNFQLSSLLHVPKIDKNLISVNQFTRENGVFVEFYPTCFFVKDLYP